MKFQTDRDTLLRPLRVVTGVVERRKTLPVLSNLLVEAGDAGLRLCATDLEVEIVARIKDGVKVEQHGATTMPAYKLADIWQSLPESATVDVTLEEGRAIVRSGRSRFALGTIPVADFPNGPSLLDVGGEGGDQGGEGGTGGDDSGGGGAGEAGVEIVLPHTDVRRLLDRTKFSMANQDVRYFLNGLLLELTAQNLRAAASDGHRMAMCTLDGGAQTAEPVRVIVPRKGVQDLERLLTERDDDVHFVLGRNYLRVSQGEYTLTTKLVDGQFPDVDRLIPRNTSHAFVGDRRELHQALHRVSILSNEKSQDVRLHIDGDQLTLRTTNPEQEEAEEVVAVDYDGKAMEIGFNVRYLQDVLGALDTESIKVSMPEDNTIALLEGPGAEDSLYLVMPLRR